MRKWVTSIAWLVPLCIHSADAHAWGLVTHVYFAQLLAWAIPLADPRLRRLVKELPHLVMAGACLPDLAIVGKAVGTEAFADNHRWETVAALLRNADDDQERALAIGYASHLLVDVIAHNHFVPTHESLWVDLPLVTHLAAEWAMDSHVRSHLFSEPSDLLRREQGLLANYVSSHFHCSDSQAHRAIATLATADYWLRRSRVPDLLYHGGRRLDPRLRRRFDNFIDQTAGRLGQINRLLDGEAPAWSADALCRRTARANVERYSQRQLKLRLPLPGDLFLAAEQRTGGVEPAALATVG